MHGVANQLDRRGILSMQVGRTQIGVRVVRTTPKASSCLHQLQQRGTARPSCWNSQERGQQSEVSASARVVVAAAAVTAAAASLAKSSSQRWEGLRRRVYGGGGGRARLSQRFARGGESEQKQEHKAIDDPIALMEAQQQPRGEEQFKLICRAFTEAGHEKKKWVNLKGLDGTVKSHVTIRILKTMFEEQDLKCAVIFVPTLDLTESWKSKALKALQDMPNLDVLKYVTDRDGLREAASYEAEQARQRVSQGGRCVIVASIKARHIARSQGVEKSLLDLLQEYDKDKWIAVLDQAHEMAPLLQLKNSQRRKALPRRALFLSATPSKYVLDMCTVHPPPMVVRQSGTKEPTVELISQGVFLSTCCRSVLKDTGDGQVRQTLIYVRTQEDGESLEKEMRYYLSVKLSKDEGHEPEVVAFITHETEKTRRESVKQDFKDGRIKILISIQMLHDKEGVQVPLVIVSEADKFDGIVRSQECLGQMAQRASGGELIFVVQDPDALRQPEELKKTMDKIENDRRLQEVAANQTTPVLAGP